MKKRNKILLTALAVSAGAAGIMRLIHLMRMSNLPFIENELKTTPNEETKAETNESQKEVKDPEYGTNDPC